MRLTIALAGLLLTATHTASAAPLTPVVSAPVVMAEGSDGTVVASRLHFATFLDAAGEQVLFEAGGLTQASQPLSQWWVARSDGSGLRRVPVSIDPTIPHGVPVPGADGARFAYVRYDSARGTGVSLVDVDAGTHATSTFTGRRLWAPPDGGGGQTTQLLAGIDGGFYAYGTLDGLLRIRRGTSTLEAVPMYLDGKRVPRATRVFDSLVPDTGATSRSGGAFGVCRSYGPSSRGPRDAIGLLDQRSGTLRLRTVRRRTDGRPSCLVSDDGSTVTETVPAAGEGKTLIALRNGRWRSVSLGRRFSELRTISASGRYVIALRKRSADAIPKLVDLDTGRSRVLAGARLRYIPLDDFGGPPVPDPLVRWTPDERTVVFNGGTTLLATDVASGRTIRLSTPQLPRPVDSFVLQMVASDSRSVFVTSRHPVGGSFGFSTPVTQTSGAQLLTSRPLPEGTVASSRDGSRVLFSYFGPDEQDPRQDLMIGANPAALDEPWTLPSGATTTAGLM
jgi:hypothetical protein